MSATFTADGVDPISRLRTLVSDEDISAYTHSNERLYGFLESSLSPQWLGLYIPSGQGYSAATVEVLMVSGVYTLRLKRGSDTAQTVTLATASNKNRTVGEVIDDIRALSGVDWQIALCYADRQYWIQVEADGWRGGLTGDPLNLYKHAKAGDLALTREGARSAYGTQDTPARLRFYEYPSAVLAAMRQQSATEGWRKSEKQGNRAWTNEAIGDRLKQMEALVCHGIYAGL